MLIPVALELQGHASLAYKKVCIHRPMVGDLVTEGELRWTVKEVRLIHEQELIGALVEPYNEGAKLATADVTGKLLSAAGWEIFWPKAHQN